MTKLHKMSPARAYRAGITQGKRGKNKLQILFKLIYQNKAPLRCGADLGACGRSEDTKI